jgi:hypothetical protein
MKYKPIPFIIFASPFVLPSILMTLTNYPALSLGIYLNAFFILLYVAIRRKSILKGLLTQTQSTFILIVVLLYLLILHFFTNTLMHETTDFLRFSLSLLLISLVILSASLFCNMIEQTNILSVKKLLKIFLNIMVVNAVLGIFGFAVFKYTSSKPVGIFSEPSHFALALSPFLIYACAIGLRFNFAYLTFFLIWGVFVENTTMLAVVALTALVSLRKKIIVIAIMALSVIMVFLDKSQYFLERLAISSDTDNLSVIALLRGWEIAVLTLVKTNYLGGGFQQYGLLGLDGDFSERLNSMDLGYLNLLDGASAAAKIVGEFGVIGVVLLMIYCFFMIRSLAILRKYRFAPDTSADAKSMLFHSFIVSLFVELFIRGVGYSSTGFFCFFVAFIYFYKNKHYRYKNS